MGKKKFIDKKKAQTFVLMGRSRSDHLFYDSDATPNILMPKDQTSSIGALISNQLGPQYGDNNELEEEEEYDEEEEEYLRKREGRIYGETNDEYGFPMDGTDYQKYLADADGGVFVAKGGEVFDEAPKVHIDEELLPEDMRSAQLPMAVNLKYDEVDPELLAAMEEIENQEWKEGENEEGFLMDDFIQQAIQAPEDTKDFDFEKHIRELLKAREEKNQSNVELTEDRYAEDIQREGSEGSEGREKREIDYQYAGIKDQYTEDEDEDEEIKGHIAITSDLFHDILDEYMEEQEKEDKKAKEALNHEAQVPTAYQREEEEEKSETEEEEEIADLIEKQFAKPPPDEYDCESICSTYSNLLNHPKLVSAKPMKIGISKKSGMPIVEREIEEPEVVRDDDEYETVVVENYGEKRNKWESKEDKRLRKQQVKEMKAEKREQKKQLKQIYKDEKKLSDHKKASTAQMKSFKV